MMLVLASAHEPSPSFPLRFRLVSGPAGMAVQPDGTLTWDAPRQDGPSTHRVVVSITDGITTAASAFDVVVTEVNAAPTPSEDTISVARMAQIRIPVEAILSNDTDPDGDTVHFDSVQPLSSAGGSVQVRGMFIVYTPPGTGTGTDILVYSVGDGRGGLTPSKIHVTLTDPAPPAPGDMSLVSLRATPQSVVVEFVGIRGRRYVIERAPNMLSPWSMLATVTADAFGRIRFEDTSPLDSMGYYRITRATSP